MKTTTTGRCETRAGAMGTGERAVERDLRLAAWYKAVVDPDTPGDVLVTFERELGLLALGDSVDAATSRSRVLVGPKGERLATDDFWTGWV